MGGRAILAVLLGLAAAAAFAQDVERGRRLFVDTGGATGRPVGNCVACHADGSALRGMIENRGGKPQDARSVRRVLQRALDGALPGAAGAKSQYRGVLTPRDLDDLAAWIARSRAA